ncbi:MULTISPECIES: hypothetical protein [unclassified Providencia]|uniref:hypothetical protein n=1 Tax=Providencia TaxID=586 RepID=UPI0023498862|nr:MULTISPECIES: hypothetical protein [unclassified Providencia]
MINLKALFEKDAAERYKVPLWMVEERRDQDGYNIDSSSILSMLHWEWLAWQRCRDSLARESMASSPINESDKKTIADMRDLAISIEECLSEPVESRGDEIIHLYDRSDTVFSAKNVNVLLGIIDNFALQHTMPVIKTAD